VKENEEPEEGAAENPDDDANKGEEKGEW
jgi:hypothetical protein